MSNTLIVYYSYAGNTEKVAKRIHEKTGFELLKLNPQKPYTGSYDQVVNQGHQEVNRDFRPQLKTDLTKLTEFRNIILCSPIWWYTFAPVIKSFLGEIDTEGKTIIPFITNGGYGLGHSLEDLKKICPKSKILECLEVPFEEDIIQIPINSVDEHLKKLMKVIDL